MNCAFPSNPTRASSSVSRVLFIAMAQILYIVSTGAIVHLIRFKVSDHFACCGRARCMPVTIPSYGKA
jgi:hypothetical protein